MAYNTADDIMSKLDDIANDIMNLTIRVNRIDNTLGHGVIDIIDLTNLISRIMSVLLKSAVSYIG